MTRLRSFFSKAQLLLLLSFGICVTALALTEPGTLIFNRAEIFFQTAEKEEFQQAISNRSSVVVGRLYAFSVENTHDLDIEAGVVAQFPHRIVNQGNVEDSYTITFDGYDVSVFEPPLVYVDSNRNGRADANEPLLNSTVHRTGLIAAEESIDLVITARVSHLLGNGVEKPLSFVVDSDNSDKSFEVTDSITVGSPGKLEILLRTFPECSTNLFPGDLITHRIDASNAGTRALVGTNYVIDGQVNTGLVFEVPVATNTAFYDFDSESTDNADGIQLVQLEGAAGNEWVRVDNRPGDVTVSSAGYFIESDALLHNEGASFGLQYTVTDTLVNQSSVLTTAVYDADSDGVPDVVSNSTCNTFSAVGAALGGDLQFMQPAGALMDTGATPDFLTDSDFINAQQYQLKRNPADPYAVERDGMYLQLNLTDAQHEEIRTDSSGKRYVIATISSRSTDDSVNSVLMETDAPGVFRSIAPIELSLTGSRSEGGICPADYNARPLTPRYDQSNPGCILQSADSDELEGRFGNSQAGFVVASVAFVSKQSVVFGTQKLQPVPGSLVQIRLADTGEVGMDSVTGVVFEFMSDAEGKFSMPRLEEETAYYLDVIPAPAYRFPSEVPAYRLTDFDVHGFSYGREGFVERVVKADLGVFFGASLNAQESIDIPLDPVSVGRLLSVDKVAMQSTVDVGQSLFYTVTVKNSSAEDLNTVVINDTLPFGFRYVAGTAVVRGVEAKDPVRSDNGDLKFLVGPLASQEAVKISYAVRATAASIDGDGINTVTASGMTVARQVTDSLPATAKVTLRRGGVFSDKAALFGKIYVDQNCDGLQNNKEWPIGGVRLYLQDGTYVITDGDGLYSVYGLDPGSYVLAVDTYTLPEGLDLKLLAVDQAADADSRFVELSEGDFHRADFAAGCPRSDVERIFAEIKQRNKTIDGTWYLQRAENINALDSSRRDDPRSRVSTSDGDLSNGIMDGPTGYEGGGINGGIFEHSSLDEEGLDEVQDDLAVDQQDKQKMQDAREIVSGITRDQAKAGTWLWPRNDLSVNGRFMAVIRSGIDPTLYVNDRAVPTSHIGERMVNRREKAQVVAWYGVELEAGENKVEVKGTGPFGNERVLASGIFKRPSSGSAITLTPESQSVPADGGRTTLPVTLRIVDSNGYPALGVYYITLDSTDGSWVEADIQTNQPGRQIRVENGVRTVHYRSSGVTGDVRVRASTGEFSEELVIKQVAARRPLVVAGFVEAGAYFATEQLGEFSTSTDLGNLSTKGRFESRAALFVKGTVKDNYNLTLSYDSDKSSEQQLLRDINPTLHYPIHGDASIRGFEAQSRSKLYVRIERDSNSVMWGDFLTDADNDRRDLGRINRALTGLNSVFDDGKNRLRIFAAREENNNINEEIEGNGSALLYRLQQYPIVSNSETVEVITRSRENRGLILDSVRLNRLGDYTIDDELGYLSFASAIPTFDEDQNPVYIRVSYDVENNGKNYLVSGARFDRRASERLSLGASITHDGHSTEGRKLIGVYGEYKLGKQTRLALSMARSDTPQQGVGLAHSMSVEHTWKGGGSTVLTHVQADSDFNNVGVSATSGRTETTIRHSQKISDKTGLLLDANRSHSSVADDERRSLSAVLETSFYDWYLRGGLKQIEQKSDGETDSFLTSLLGVRRKFNIMGKDGQTDIEYEQDLGRIERRRIAASAKIKVHTDISAYTRYEHSNSLLGLAGLSTDIESELFTLGVESNALPSTKLYSEYRLRGAFESREYETASGVRADYEVMEGLRISPHFEYIKRLGEGNTDSVSASVAVTDTRNPRSRKILRFETRQSAESDHYGIRASLASRINNDWTAVVTDNLSRQENTGTESVHRHTLVAALTRRPKYENRHHMLFMYRLNQESGVTDGLDRTAHVLSTHQNLQIDNSTIFSGRVGVKQDNSQFEVSSVSDFAMLADARLSFDLGRRINFDTGVGALSTNGLSEVRYSMGLGINYVLNRNLRLNLAYNLVGFKDDELDAEQYNAKGAHVGLQYKLDEEQFKWLK